MIANTRYIVTLNVHWLSSSVLRFANFMFDQHLQSNFHTWFTNARIKKIQKTNVFNSRNNLQNINELCVLTYSRPFPCGLYQPDPSANERYVNPQHIIVLNVCRPRRRSFWRMGCAMWFTWVHCSWRKNMIFTGSERSLHIFTSCVVQNKKWTRKTLVANEFLQNEVCV
jgi:hypothetical protein